MKRNDGGGDDKKKKSNNDGNDNKSKQQFFKGFGANIGTMISKGGNSIKDKLFKKKQDEIISVNNINTASFTPSNKTNIIEPTNTTSVNTKNMTTIPSSVTKTQAIINNKAIPSTTIDNKAFTVQLSIAEDKDNIYQINDDEDEDEEEEEEDEEVNNEPIQPNQIKQEKAEQNQISNSMIESSSKVQHDILQVKLIELQSDTTSFIFKDKPKTKTDRYLFNKERDLETTTVCHFLYKKGEYIDTLIYQIHHFHIIKTPKKNVLSIISSSFGKKSEDNLLHPIEKKYLGIFDENFIYFLKDINVDKRNISIRKIDNKMDLTHLSNITIANSTFIMTLSFTIPIEQCIIKKKVLRFSNKDEMIFFGKMVQFYYKFNIKDG